MISTATPLPKGQVRRKGGGRRGDYRDGSRPRPRAPAAGRACHTRRSDAAVDLGVEEHGQARGGADGDGASDQRRHGAQGTGEAWFLAAVQSQGGRGLETPGPRRAVRVYRCESRYGTVTKATRHLRRHEEEGADRQLQERRHGLSSQGRPAARERARLRGQAAWQDRAVRRLRCDGQCRLRQRRNYKLSNGSRS